MNPKIARYFEQHRPSTPCLVVDLEEIERNFHSLTAALPQARIYYAVKANPAAPVLRLLERLGSCFDTASIQEIEMVLAAGAGAERISYGNTIKKQADIARAYERGVRLYAFDSREELLKLAAAAPGSRVFCRILVDCSGAEWPLTRKFGCEPSMASELLQEAATLGLVPYGVSFHVGSQQRHPEQWEMALTIVAALFRELDGKGIRLGMINLGGGFPTRYREDILDNQVYGEAIGGALARHFGGRPLEAIIEPGRGMVGSAGVIESEVVLISRKSRNDRRRWVFLDIGKFGGLAECMDEAIKYPIDCTRSGPLEPVILAGPTCDSADIMYERTPYSLPADLAIGDRVRIHATGAYTTPYSTVGFNGFPPLSEYYI